MNCQEIVNMDDLDHHSYTCDKPNKKFVRDMEENRFINYLNFMIEKQIKGI